MKIEVSNIQHTLHLQRPLLASLNHCSSTIPNVLVELAQLGSKVDIQLLLKFLFAYATISSFTINLVLMLIS